ncbi:hypothetical protein ACFVTX_02180 [Agromyces sp. NPDC058136]|uniref:hypothetical protein n=1 Tax=Agromyces sp. NPDC058136 TaxID=3346354 RepID=UPI0036DA05EC
MISLILNVVRLLSGIFVIIWYRRNHRPVWRSLGLTVNRWTLPDIAVGLAIPFIAISLVFVVERALGAIEVTGGADDWSGIAGVIGQVIGFALILRRPSWARGSASLDAPFSGLVVASAALTHI